MMITAKNINGATQDDSIERRERIFHGYDLVGIKFYQLTERYARRVFGKIDNPYQFLPTEIHWDHTYAMKLDDITMIANQPYGADNKKVRRAAQKYEVNVFDMGTNMSIWYPGHTGMHIYWKPGKDDGKIVQELANAAYIGLTTTVVL